MTHTVTVDLDGRQITLETGKIAKQAGGAVVVRSGDSVVLVSAGAMKNPKVGAAFFPLTVITAIHTYAAGKFPALHQARRTPNRKRGSHQPVDRPAHPPVVPRGLFCETQVIGWWAFGRSERRSGPAGHRWRSGALAIFRHPVPFTCCRRSAGQSVNGKLIANPSYERPGTRGSTSSSRAPKKVSSWWTAGVHRNH